MKCHTQLSGITLLKLGLDSDSLTQEVIALRAFSGFGVADVLSETNEFLLQTRAIPGIPLKSYFPKKENEAIHITAHLIQQLQKAPIPPTHSFPHIKDWLIALDNNWNIHQPYLDHARKLRDNLLSISEQDVFLHGDLHHDNILQDENGWVVIDPKGVIGDAAYEVAAFIRNPIPELLEQDNALSIIQHRITLFAEILELSERRILDWCFVQAVLAWIWTLEDLPTEEVEAQQPCEAYFKNLTELFSRMIHV